MSIRPFSWKVIFVKEQFYCCLLKFSRNISVRRNRKLDFWEKSAFGEFPPPIFDWPAGPARRERKVVLGIFYWPWATGPVLISSPACSALSVTCSTLSVTCSTLSVTCSALSVTCSTLSIPCMVRPFHYLTTSMCMRKASQVVNNSQ